MFEHLGPRRNKKKNQPAGNHFVYLSMLTAASLVLLFVTTINKGPQTSAADEAVVPEATVGTLDAARTVVYKSPEVSALNFFINTQVDGVALTKLQINVSGVYDVALLENLRLYHGQTQLGNYVSVDEAGNIYYELIDYYLTAGRNDFHLILTMAPTLEQTGILEFSLPERSSVGLNYRGHTFTPQGDWPVSGGVISFVPYGKIIAFNDPLASQSLISARQQNKIFTFGLSADGETADISRLVLSYAGPVGSQTSFMLSVGDEQLLQSSADRSAQQIVFDLPQPLVLPVSQSLTLGVHAFNLPVGNYQFRLESVTAVGYISGQANDLAASLDFSDVYVRDNFPYLTVGQLNDELRPGWNQIFNLRVDPSVVESLNVERLSWLVDVKGADIIGVDVMLNNKSRPAEYVWDGNKLIVNWQPVLTIPKTGADISLMLNVEATADSAIVQAYLLPDQDDDLETANIIWSANQGGQNSGYLLPGLPLSPGILTVN